MQTDSMTMTGEEAEVSTIPPATGSSNINVGQSERIVSALLGTAATLYGLRNLSSLGGIAMTVAGGMLLSRGLSGYCAVNNAIGRNSAIKTADAIEARESYVINKPKEEVYSFWRQLDNLPRFMRHLEEVKVEDETRSVWKAKVPGGVASVTWEAMVTEDKPGELIAWSSLPGSTIDTAGEVRFKDAANGLGTEIQAVISYRLPGGVVGSVAGKLINPAVESMVKEDLGRLKSVLESTDDSTSETETMRSSPEADMEKPRKRRRKNATSPDQEMNTASGSQGQSDQINESDLLERY